MPRRSPPGWRPSPLHGQSWGRFGRRAGAGRARHGRTADVIWQDWFAELPQAISPHPGLRRRALAARSGPASRCGHGVPALVQQEPRCLLHGDAHIGNAYMERTAPSASSTGRRWPSASGPTTSTTSWSRRWTFPTAGSTSANCSALPEGACEPRRPSAHPDEAWEQYRRSTVYGFLCWLCNPDIWQPEEVNTATFARFAAAMLDHDTYAAIGV